MLTVRTWCIFRTVRKQHLEESTPPRRECDARIIWVVQAHALLKIPDQPYRSTKALETCLRPAGEIGVSKWDIITVVIKHAGRAGHFHHGGKHRRP